MDSLEIKFMKTNKVKLTENQFYNLIKECTKRALQELDKSTYKSGFGKGFK